MGSHSVTCHPTGNGSHDLTTPPDWVKCRPAGEKCLVVIIRASWAGEKCLVVIIRASWASVGVNCDAVVRGIAEFLFHRLYTADHTHSVSHLQLYQPCRPTGNVMQGRIHGGGDRPPPPDGCWSKNRDARTIKSRFCQSQNAPKL